MEAASRSEDYLYTFSKQCFDHLDNEPIEEERPRDKNGIIRTLIADDHPYLVHGVEEDLKKDKKIKIIGTACSYDDVLTKVRRLMPNVVLLDLKMPGYEKYNLASFINRLKIIGNCRVIIFSNETGWARIHRCLDIGASAYVEKAISVGRLSEFINRVYNNEEIVIYTAEKLPKILFSKRQEEILHHIADGKENDEISGLVGIEFKTVQSYVHQIKAKLAQAFAIHPVRPRTLLLLASKLGFGNKVA